MDVPGNLEVHLTACWIKHAMSHTPRNLPPWIQTALRGLEISEEEKKGVQVYKHLGV